MITKFVHGLHVIIGTIFLTISLGRLIANHFTDAHHLNFELAIMY
jgi:heme/copper-type cytochrome/quinol oxidase subunit 3